ncbi:hypothetical protein [Corynebacterium lowii]|uniref:Major Facilitator Superfamily protein n=1 Tax=Corynebacterium lowii TaxID=1544413 RepID=A0A0N8W046_9CORY|nr:hypothetical protein [Corynebacterium lowii]KQB85682.1 Major Facilitator Superfamily protein [Corynebacterium lowii]MDP9850982.1 MFS family permease [Corynebacterium lowii]
MRAQVIFFSLLFTAGMWMSKVAQPLYFEGRGAMIAFGVGYAVMAVVGGFSFAWGYLADRLGGFNAVRLGAFVYALGLGGRIFTDLVPSVIFSAIAGAGASLALVGIRPWIRSRVADEEIPKIVASRSLGNQSGVFVGTLGAALIFALASQAEAGQRTALLMAPFLVMLAVAWISFAGRSARYAVPAKNNDVVHDKAATRVLVVKLAVLGVLSGFYVSLVAPYIPVIFTRAGLTDARGLPLLFL